MKNYAGRGGGCYRPRWTTLSARFWVLNTLNKKTRHTKETTLLFSISTPSREQFSTLIN